MNDPTGLKQPMVKDKLAMCVSGLLFHDQDVSLRIIEWFEMMREQKYDKVQ